MSCAQVGLILVKKYGQDLGIIQARRQRQRYVVDRQVDDDVWTGQDFVDNSEP